MLEVLGSRLEAALDGDGSCVMLSGEAGIGKSRLAREVTRQGAARGATAVVGRAVPSGTPAAYRPLAEAVAQGLRHRPVLDDPGLAAWLPALHGIVPPRDRAGAAGELPPAVRGEAVLQLLARLAEPDGLVVVLEDLHWADPDTLAVVEYLGDNVTDQRVLCVMTLRSDERSPALALVRRPRTGTAPIHLELGRLEPDDVVEMATICAPGAGRSTLERVCARAEGVPLLVEELLASPGVPVSFLDAVRRRLALLPEPYRRVLGAAALLGRRFDWRLLPPMVRMPAVEVSGALEAAVEQLLLTVEDGAFRFRHALTREAILGDLLPPEQQALAADGLMAVDAAHPDLAGGAAELAADLAERAGDRDRAAALLTTLGETALRAGGIGTAAQHLERAAGLARPGEGRARAVLLQVEALALAGRVDEAAAAARRPLDLPFDAARHGEVRVELSLSLAEAAVAAGRWGMAADELRTARRLERRTTDPVLRARTAVLQAEVALAADDLDLARAKARRALGDAHDAPEVRCHALEVLGRVDRLRDPASARDRFEQALAEADAAGLAVWRARALHELGTIDMFDHLGVERLEQARRAAAQIGALSTAASIDLQLAAVGISRWTPDETTTHAGAALELAERLDLDAVRAKALLFLAEAGALRGDPDGAEHHLQLARLPEAIGSPAEGFCWGVRGEAALAAGEVATAVDHLERATTILDAFPHAEPAAFRALWPLLLAAVGDGSARSALDRARRSGVAAFRLNRGLMGYAEAVVAGQAGEPERARSLVRAADGAFENARTWRVLARVIAAPVAVAGGWGTQPRKWVGDGVETFERLGLARLAAWCRQRIADDEPARSAPAGITPREADVLALVADGLANKEIAQRLHLSTRTVEKHMEALLRKTRRRSRTQLAIWAHLRDTRPTRSSGLR